MDFRQIRRDLGRKLAAGEPYLWIVDDLPPGLDQEQGIPGWCAPSANGRTLITTHSKDYAGLGVTIEIDVLETEPAWELLYANTLMRPRHIKKYCRVDDAGGGHSSAGRRTAGAERPCLPSHPQGGPHRRRPRSRGKHRPHHVLEAIQHRTLFWIDA